MKKIILLSLLITLILFTACRVTPQSNEPASDIRELTEEQLYENINHFIHYAKKDVSAIKGIYGASMAQVYQNELILRELRND